MPNVTEKVFNNSLQTCEYISGYINSNSIIKVHCLIHNYDFETKYENVRRDNRKHKICPKCQQEERNIKYSQHRITLTCDYCGKTFTRPISKLDDSKHQFYFCSRECKDLAQQITSGQKFNNMRPEHYGTNCDAGITSYRRIAFTNYPHECACCGYKEDTRILQVHHKDENRMNNSLNNLIILCPNCHQKLTLHLYKLENNQLILI